MRSWRTDTEKEEELAGTSTEDAMRKSSQTNLILSTYRKTLVCYGSGQGPVEGFYEHGIKPSGSINFCTIGGSSRSAQLRE
jgi:hypothetical protein